MVVTGLTGYGIQRHSNAITPCGAIATDENWRDLDTHNKHNRRIQ